MKLISAKRKQFTWPAHVKRRLKWGWNWVKGPLRSNAN